MVHYSVNLTGFRGKRVFNGTQRKENEMKFNQRGPMCLHLWRDNLDERRATIKMRMSR